MTWGKSVLLTVPLVLSGIFVVVSPASAKDFSATDWKSVSAGGSHACAITNSGYLYCWGNDDHGQLGNSSTFNSKTTPNQVGGSSGWTAVGAGGDHTCGIRSGKLYCWGSDRDGQLGNAASSTGDKGVPQPIGSASDWKTVSAGGSHTCAIRGTGVLYCWGDDSNGQLGNGSVGRKTYPYRIAGTASNWTSVSAGGSHTCAIRGTGVPYCWGDDSNGQLGNGSAGSKTYPYRIAGTATNWKSVSAGGTHTCAILSTGYLYCWGDDSNGQLGNGSAGSKTYPYRVANPATSWRSVSAGGSHTCAIRGTGYLYCWGDNEYGQTVASSEDRLFTSPQQYPGSWKAGQDAGQRHTCAIKGDGTLNCWGVPEPPPPNDCPTDRPTNVYAGDPWPDLGYWKLTTPVDANNDGKLDEVKQPALKTWDNPDYFDRLSSPTRIRFRADVDGATTSGSSFPRSELREMTQDGQYNRAAWSSKCGTHTMTVTQAITHLPEVKDEVVAGQIHDQADDVVMIRLEGSRLFVEADGNEVGLLDDRYGLSERFTATVTATKSGITITYDNLDSTASNATVQYNPPVNDELWYFKAGCYTQSNTDSDAGTAYGEVIIYDLDVQHS